MKKCAICGHTKLLNQDMSLFQTPSATNKLQEWSVAAGIELTSKCFVCMKHFQKKYITTHNDGDEKIIRRTLAADAVPRLNLGSKSHSSPADDVKPSSNVFLTPNRYKSKIINKIESLKSHQEIIPPVINLNPSKKFQDQPSDFQSNPILPVEPIVESVSLYEYLKQNPLQINSSLPLGWGIHEGESSITISHIKSGVPPKIDKAIVIDKTNLKIFVNNIFRPPTNAPTNLEGVLGLIKSLNSIKVCTGTGINNTFSPSCSGEHRGSRPKRCTACSRFRKHLARKNRKLDGTKMKLKVQISRTKNRCSYLRKRYLHQSKTIANLQRKMAEIKNIDSIISKLPDNQKSVVKTCLETASRHPFGRRYSKDWLYSCILMKIKSPKLYRHLRNRELLPLPAPSTISKYIRNIDSTYGFQNKLFELIKEKTKHMPEYERHGTLMVDECKVTPSKYFDKNRLEVLGYVDLGNYTPEMQKDQLGDHALVIMFQSFAGKHIQALACFLSRGSVLGSIQAKLILEAILLCEAAGLFIDVVTSDGATWNRAMWRAFDAGNPEAPWCIHPCNQERKLRMCSDYLHLLKCIRNRLVAKKEFHVPEGHVQLKHFEDLIAYDAKHEFKLAPKLTRKHVHPQIHEKMKTKYAFQLFSGTVADALTVLKDKNVFEFLDCEPTIQFCRRINLLSDILNSNNPFNALRPKSSQQKELEDFLLYMDLWESCSEPDFFLTKSTSEGLRATINTTLDLLTYCTTDLKFKYLMTTRINQDPLEHFFGLLRASGGANNNPESLQVAQLFKLLSLYSLVKPPAGSNVTGGNMLEALIKDTPDVLDCNPTNKQNVMTRHMDLQLDQALDEDFGYVSTEFKDNEEAFAYVCGAIARRHRVEKCLHCVETLVGDGVESFNTFIILRSRGHLTFPSVTLVTLLQEVESIIAENLKAEIQKNTLLEILDKIGTTKIHNYVGCAEHKATFTKKIVISFLITRMSFSCQKEARKRSCENAASGKHAKLAKLV